MTHELIHEPEYLAYTVQGALYSALGVAPTLALCRRIASDILAELPQETK